MIKLTNPLNLNPHIITMIQNDLRLPHRPDPRRRPRHDQRPALQRGSLGQESDRLRHAEDHFFRIRVLDDGAVVDGFDTQVVRVGDVLLRDEDGANGRGGVES